MTVRKSMVVVSDLDKQILKSLLPEAHDKVWVIDLKKKDITDFGTMKQQGFGIIPE